MKVVANNEAKTFASEWATFHGRVPPLGWMLRGGGTIPWVRFHALPASKRYADSDDERATIIARGNALANRLLGEGSSCWWIEARADDATGAGGLAHDFRESGDPGEPLWRFYARAVEWRSGAFDEELAAIANDNMSGLWMRRADGVVFAPYDGGFDLFPTSWSHVEMFKLEWTDWLSPHPEGL